MLTGKGGRLRAGAGSTRRGRLAIASLLALATWLIASAFATSGEALATGYQAVGWGENFRGQIGAFWRSNAEPRPIAVEGLTNIASLATGNSFDLMLLDDGTVRSSGADQKGQLGDGAWANTWERGISHATVAESAGPLEHVTQVAGGGEHAVALLESGVVKTWGTNEDGNLGNGHAGFEIKYGEEEERRPKTVNALQEEEGLSVIGVAAGWGDDFALMSDHTLRGWGGDQDGELGIDLEGCEKLGQAACESFTCNGEVPELCSDIPRPVVYEGGGEVEEVAEAASGGEASYARLESGKVLSWGANLRGQLGTGGPTHNSRLTPPAKVQMNGGDLTNVKQIAAGYNHAVAIREGSEGDEVIGWGSNEKGELGELPAEGEECANDPCYTTAARIPGFPVGSSVEAVAAGTGYTLALINHKVWAVGANETGELGNGEENGPEDCRTPAEVTEKAKEKPCARTPAVVTMPGNVRAVAAQGEHSLALLDTGVSAPAPELTVTPEKGALKYTWPATAPNGSKLDARPWERPEFEVELSGTGEQIGSEPFNTVRPHVSSQNNPYVGKVLKAEPGIWIGTPAPTLSYQWQRCGGWKKPEEGKCTAISGATGSEYTIAEADVGDTVRIAVTGNNGGESSVTVHSPPTELVALTSESKKASTETISLKGKTSVTLNKYEGFGLSSKIPYEVKLNIGGIPRVTVGQPLP